MVPGNSKVSEYSNRFRDWSHHFGLCDIDALVMTDRRNPRHRTPSPTPHVHAHLVSYDQLTQAQIQIQLSDIHRGTHAMQRCLIQWHDFLKREHDGVTGRKRINNTVKLLATHLEYFHSEDATKAVYDLPKEQPTLNHRNYYIGGFDDAMETLMALDKEAYDQLREAAQSRSRLSPIVKEALTGDLLHLQQLRIKHETHRILLLMEVDREERHRADLRREAKCPTTV